MKNTNKRKGYNLRWGGGFLGKVWIVVVGYSTLSGVIYMNDVIREYWSGSKKRAYDFYDEDVISKTNEYMTESVKKGVELDYDETLNKFQELKNLEKMNKVNKKDD